MWGLLLITWHASYFKPLDRYPRNLVWNVYSEYYKVTVNSLHYTRKWIQNFKTVYTLLCKIKHICRWVINAGSSSTADTRALNCVQGDILKQKQVLRTVIKHSSVSWGYNAMQSAEYRPKFRRNMSPPAAWLLSCFFRRPWRWRQHDPSKCQFTSANYTVLHRTRQSRALHNSYLTSLADKAVCPTYTLSKSSLKLRHHQQLNYLRYRFREIKN
jgi:hypothetical protein